MIKEQWTNEQVSQLLEEIAAVYEIKGENYFRILAYQKAGSAIAEMDLEIQNIWKENKLEDIPGIGKAIASYLDELFKTGKVKHFDEIRKDLPQGMFELMKVASIGPKTSYKLASIFKLKHRSTALEELKMAALDKKISQLPGFGEKKEQEILENINRLQKQAPKRCLIVFSDQISQKLKEYMKGPDIEQIEVLGSLRRRMATVGDIDIGIATFKAKAVIDKFVHYPQATAIQQQGENKASIMVGKYQIDLRVIDPDSWGSMMQHFTGSKDHNIHLREICVKKKLSLSEYGIRKQNKLIKFRNEKDFYHYLGMDWIPAELREDSGEIEASLKHKLPKLVDIKDIKGDLHIHSSFNIEPSHDLGNDSMELIVKKAQYLGYEYIGFSEHNPSAGKHTNREIYSILLRKKEYIDKLNYTIQKNKKNIKNKVFVFNSLEIDIKPNGELAIDQSSLNLLDFAIVSIHSSFNMGKTEMTNRIIKAFSNPKIKILGHPTGRLIQKREGYELDWDKIFDFCLKNSKYIEVNSNPYRLDLPSERIREAIKYKVKLCLNSDSHSVEELDYIKYGVDNAKKGWARKSDFINSLGYNEFRKIILSE